MVLQESRAWPLLHSEQSVRGQDSDRCVLRQTNAFAQQAFRDGIVVGNQCFFFLEGGVPAPHIRKRDSRCRCTKVFGLSSESLCLFHLPFTLHIRLALGRKRADLHRAPRKHSQPTYLAVSWSVRTTTVYRAEPFPVETGIPGRVTDRPRRRSSYSLELSLNLGQRAGVNHGLFALGLGARGAYTMVAR